MAAIRSFLRPEASTSNAFTLEVATIAFSSFIRYWEVMCSISPNTWQSQSRKNQDQLRQSTPKDRRKKKKEKEKKRNDKLPSQAYAHGGLPSHGRACQRFPLTPQASRPRLPVPQPSRHRPDAGPYFLFPLISSLVLLGMGNDLLDRNARGSGMPFIQGRSG